jgi:hypothetical protein
VSSGASAPAYSAPIRPESFARRQEIALWLVVGFAVALAFGAALRGVQPLPILALLVIPLSLIAWQRTLLAWSTMLGAILVVMLLIPIRRYTVGGGLPIELEPYRVLIAVVLACWLAALAADPRVSWRQTGLEGPIMVFGAAILCSLALNVGRVNEVSDIVLKQLSFFVSFFLVVYFVSSVVDSRARLDRMLRLAVAGGTLVAIAALVEWRTGTNLFTGLNRVMPFLHYQDIGDAMLRGNGARALASAQHPIALGALLVMLLPVTVYLYRRDGRAAWLGCSAFLTLGALASGSRTAALMLLTVAVAFLWLKRDQALRLIPAAIPLIIVIQVVMPGTLGTFRGILQPSYIIKEQSTEMGAGSGRIADLGPSLEEFSSTPFFGQGFGTRVVTKEGEPGGAQILDNQWLGTLLEIGAIGALGLLWLFARAIRRLARVARTDPGPDGWLAATLAASLTAFAVGMFTFDAFAFIQVTFFAFIVLGFGAVLTRHHESSRTSTKMSPSSS